jgi:uncharacterized protein
MTTTMTDFDKIVSWISARGGRGAIVALSGGVDSAVVAWAAKAALGKKAIAITADYKTLSAEELGSAKHVAGEIGIAHKIIEYSELDNAEFVKNDAKRCYHCRSELGKHLAAEAEELGVDLILDGTNLDDLADYRPGIVAMHEAGVKSPLAELQISKLEVRQIARSLGLSVHDKPSNSCLASRIPTGMAVTVDRLRRIEKAESIVKSLFDVAQVRVRDHEDIARVEVPRSELLKLFDVEKLGSLDTSLKELGYRFVSIDAAGYRPGKLVILESENISHA